jgi:hypothetical protein
LSVTGAECVTLNVSVVVVVLLSPDLLPDEKGQDGSSCPRRQSSLNNLFASIVITTGTLVPSGSVSDWKIMRAWFPLLS